MLITLITPTGGRQESFTLTEKMFKAQTVYHKHKFQWIVVDDCSAANPTRCTVGQEYYKAEKQWKPGFNSHRYNLDQALAQVKGNVIFNWEDDDFYSPEYIEKMLQLLEASEIAGLSNSKYYHLKAPGHKVMDNFRHASLCQTAIRSSALPLLYEAVHSGEYYFDIHLWRAAQERGRACALLSNTLLSIGMKGLPGRSGLGAGHELVGYKGDRHLSTLRSWVGDFFPYYQNFIKM